MVQSRVCLLLLLVVASCSNRQDPGRKSLAATRPNILFIFSDDHAAHAISAYGSKINETPNIDRIAAQGMLFRNVFCGNSICGPSRATILSGQHSHINGFMRNGNEFDPGHQTFVKLLHEHGYTTAMIGKWHLTSNPTGFDHWMVLPGQGDYYNPDFVTPEGKKRVDGYVTDITTDLALDWLEKGRDKDKPFLLMCQHKAPHRSWMPGPEELGLYRDGPIPEPATLFDDYEGRGPAVARQEMEIARDMGLFYDLKLIPDARERQHLQGFDRWWDSPLKRLDRAQRQVWDAAFASENACFRRSPLTGKALVRWKYQRYITNYLRCVAGVDKSVGQLLDYLDARPELAANTIVVYSSDQGFYLGDNGWFDKRWMYEPSLRMPFLVRWPGRIAAGKQVDQLAQNIDFAPTFLDLAGIPIPRSMQGVSLLPLLEGRTPKDWRESIYYHYYESHAVHNVPAHYGIRTARYKLIYYYEPENRYWELFDLQKDPTERRSLSGDPAYAAIEAQLRLQLTQLRQQYHDDTGDFGDSPFTIMAGIASVHPVGAGWRVHANAWGSYLLEPLKEPIRDHVTLRCRILPLQQTGKREGYVLLGGVHPRKELLRVGIDFANDELRIYGSGLRKPLARTRFVVPTGARNPGAIELEVEVDLGKRTLRATALSHELEATLPKAWTEIHAIGYGASDTRTWFSPLRRDP